MLHLQKAGRRRKRMYGVPIVVQEAAAGHSRLEMAERTCRRVVERRGNSMEAPHLAIEDSATVKTPGAACTAMV